MNVQERFDKFIKDSKRVLKVSRKPDGPEYVELAKVTSIGVLIIGAIGFVIVLLGSLIGLS
jgi:protein transport protein SEC61 subunit gamma-like protein